MKLNAFVSAVLTAVAFSLALAAARNPTVKIGNQVWMTQNVNVATPGSWCYEDRLVNCDKFGRLYTWEAAMRICPAGWHLPSDDEWKALEMTLGLSREEADAIKGRGTTVADKLKPGGSSGFEAQMGGYFLPEDGKFHRGGQVATYWTMTPGDDGGAWHRDIDLRTPKIWRSTVQKGTGCSVRCVQDSPGK
jgi:uncharacterized protein (TIGR02145 family)